jgi:hypothetical protein
MRLWAASSLSAYSRTAVAASRRDAWSSEVPEPKGRPFGSATAANMGPLDLVVIGSFRHVMAAAS